MDGRCRNRFHCRGVRAGCLAFPDSPLCLHICGLDSVGDRRPCLGRDWFRPTGHRGAPGADGAVSETSALETLIVGLLVGCVFFSYASVLVARNDHNVSSLLLISRRFFDANPLARDRADIRNSLTLVEGGNTGSSSTT